MKVALDIENLIIHAATFAEVESSFEEPTLYGVTDGKAIGTYLEHKFKLYLSNTYVYEPGNSASGIDFPGLGVDLKVTSVNQPQSSCPFKSARQKIYGLGYHLLIFVYAKIDDHSNQTGRLDVRHALFVDKSKTADYMMTAGIKDILSKDGNADDIVAFLQDRFLPVDDIEAHTIAEEIIQNPPDQGFLTISNALQWRLLYSRAIQKAGEIEGIYRIR